jgi:hypothetical protein
MTRMLQSLVGASRHRRFGAKLSVVRWRVGYRGAPLACAFCSQYLHLPML